MRLRIAPIESESMNYLRKKKKGIKSKQSPQFGLLSWVIYFPLSKLQSPTRIPLSKSLTALLLYCYFCSCFRFFMPVGVLGLLCWRIIKYGATTTTYGVLLMFFYDQGLICKFSRLSLQVPKTRCKSYLLNSNQRFSFNHGSTVNKILPPTLLYDIQHKAPFVP